MERNGRVHRISKKSILQKRREKKSLLKDDLLVYSAIFLYRMQWKNFLAF